MLKNKRGRLPSLKVAAAEAAMYTHNIPYEVYIAYTEQCRNCKRRGVPLELSLEQWWDWWQEDDRWSRRGRNRGDVMMQRKRSDAAYTLDNIYAGVVGEEQDAPRSPTGAVACRVRREGRAADARPRQPPPGASGRRPAWRLPVGVVGGGRRRRLLGTHAVLV